jgi:hypothetical protein
MHGLLEDLDGTVLRPRPLFAQFLGFVEHISIKTQRIRNKTDERTEDGMELLPLTPKA